MSCLPAWTYKILLTGLGWYQFHIYTYFKHNFTQLNTNPWASAHSFIEAWNLYDFYITEQTPHLFVHTNISWKWEHLFIFIPVYSSNIHWPCMLTLHADLYSILKQRDYTIFMCYSIFFLKESKLKVSPWNALVQHAHARRSLKVSFFILEIVAENNSAKIGTHTRCVMQESTKKINK